jgi:hypothetical protein
MGDLFDNFINPDSGVKTNTKPVEFVVTNRKKRGAFSVQTRVGRMLKASESVQDWLKVINKTSKKKPMLSFFPSQFPILSFETGISNSSNSLNNYNDSSKNFNDTTIFLDKSSVSLRFPQTVVPSKHCNYLCPFCFSKVDTNVVMYLSHLTTPYIMMCSKCSQGLSQDT